MKIRTYKKSDTPSLINLFRNTVHEVCIKDYSPEQLNAWAPLEIDEAAWIERLSKSYVVIVEDDEVIVGFANLKPDGCIDMFYVHSNWQKRSVGSILYEAIITRAKEENLKSLYSDVSITARPFFIRKGFVIEKEYSKELRGCVFNNAIMTKALS